MKFKELSYLGIGIVIVFAFWVILPTKTSAVSSDNIYIEALPESPSPNENMTVTLTSYLVNLDTVPISWTINDKDVLSGIGEKVLSLSAPSIGETSVVSAKINLIENIIEKTINIVPSSALLLLWQAEDSYVPPFYKGRVLPPPGSKIKIIAVPEVKSGGEIIDPKNLIYVWKKDFTNQQDASGYGKNSFVYTGDYLDNSNIIDVTASTADGQISLSEEIEVPIFQSKLVFYKKDINLGTLYENTIESGHKVVGQEIIQAVPYFFSPKNIRDSSLRWDWYINGGMIEAVDFNPTLLPIAAPAEAKGTARIRLEIYNALKLFGDMSKEINLTF